MRAPVSSKKARKSPRKNRLLRFKKVNARTGLSRSTLWREELRGKFPGRRQLTSGAVGWLESDIDHWVATRTIAKARP